MRMPTHEENQYPENMINRFSCRTWQKHQEGKQTLDNAETDTCRGIVTVSGKSVLELIAKRIQARTSTQELFSTSFQSESHPVPLGPTDPLGQFLKDTEGKKKKTLLDKGTD